MDTTVAATFCASFVDQLARDGVRHAVICPGSRSTPLVLAADEHADLTVHVHHDERSAAFMALGIGLATGVPALIVTTSGTAAVELHPAVVEASYAAVPLLVCTADRPPELHGVGAPQTIDQQELYGTAVRGFLDAGVPDPAATAAWRGLARSAFDLAMGDDPGPVHVNLPFREPLVGRPGLVTEPLRPRLVPQTHDASVDTALLDGRRGVVVAGWGVADPAAVHAIADRLAWPVIADPRSGCRRPGSIAHADGILRSQRFVAANRPEIVLRIGALPTSKVLNQWLATCGATEVAVADRVDDPHSTVAVATHGSLDALLAASGALRPAPPDWRTSWVLAQEAAAAVIELDLDAGAVSEPSTARAALDVAPENSALVVSSSMPVRDLEAFAAPRDDVDVYANRGASGIDGVTSTAVGIALTGRPTTLVTGDLAFLHDTNGLLGVTERAVDLVIVVINNAGGGIFSFLPQARLLNTTRFERLFGTPHTADLAGLANAHGLPVSEPRHLTELRDAVSARTGGARMVLVNTDRGVNTTHHEQLNGAIVTAVERGLRDG